MAQCRCAITFYFNERLWPIDYNRRHIAVAVGVVVGGRAISVASLGQIGHAKGHAGNRPAGQAGLCDLALAGVVAGAGRAAAAAITPAAGYGYAADRAVVGIVNVDCHGNVPAVGTPVRSRAIQIADAQHRESRGVCHSNSVLVLTVKSAVSVATALTVWAQTATVVVFHDYVKGRWYRRRPKHY
jgi:hypothetical protein